MLYNLMQIATSLIINQEQQFLKNHFVCEQLRVFTYTAYRKWSFWWSILHKAMMMMMMMNNECCNIEIIQDTVACVVTKKTVSGWDWWLRNAYSGSFCLLMTHLAHKAFLPAWLHMTPRSHFKDNKTQVHGHKETMILSLAWLNLLL